jgi:TonB family protein
MKSAAKRLFQAAALVLAVTMAVPIPARADDERATKSRVAPIYPDIARRMKIAGEVDVEATVDAAGNVSDAKTLSGSRLLAPAAEDAVRKWKFESGSGTAKVKVKVNFSLE